MAPRSGARPISLRPWNIPREVEGTNPKSSSDLIQSEWVQFLLNWPIVIEFERALQNSCRRPGIRGLHGTLQQNSCSEPMAGPDVDRLHGVFSVCLSCFPPPFSLFPPNSCSARFPLGHLVVMCVAPLGRDRSTDTVITNPACDLESGYLESVPAFFWKTA